MDILSCKTVVAIKHHIKKFRIGTHNYGSAKKFPCYLCEFSVGEGVSDFRMDTLERLSTSESNGALSNALLP